MCFVACGPSAEEKAKMEAEEKAKEQKKMDSLFNAASAMPTEATTAPATTDTVTAPATTTTEKK